MLEMTITKIIKKNALDEIKQQISNDEETLTEHQTELTGGIENEDDIAQLENIVKTAKNNAQKAISALKDWAEQSALEWTESELSEKFDCLQQIQALSQSVKQAKEQLKREEPRFDEKVEAQFAQLTLQDICQLLEQKWLNALIVELENIAHSYSRNVANQIKALDERYKETLDEIQAQRKQAEEAFWAMAKLLG